MAPLTTLLFLLTSLLAPTALAAWCPTGTWQDQNGRCHFGRPPGDPIGWVGPNSNYIYPNQNNNPSLFPYGSTYYPDGRINGGYTRNNNPAQFFDGDWRDLRNVNPYRDSRRPVPYLDINWNMAARLRVVHAVMASIAFLLLFPLGAIAVALGPGMIGVGVHVGVQMLGWLFYLIAASIGLWIASTIRWRGFDLPITGALHRASFRKHNRRGILSVIHVWTGRLIIILGIIDGGLGLLISGNASSGQVMAYSIFAGLVFVVWMLASVAGMIKRYRADVPRRPKAVSPPIGR